MAEQLSQPAYEPSALQRIHGDEGIGAIGAIGIGLAGAAIGIAAYTKFWGGRDESTPNETATVEVVRVEAVPIEYMAQFDTAINNASVEAKVGGLKGKLFDGGFIATANVDTESLGGPTRESTTVEVDEATGHQTITIQQDTFDTFTRIREDSREVLAKNRPGLSGFGNGVASVLDSVHISLPDVSDRNKIQLSQYLSESIVNKVSTECAAAVFGSSEATVDNLGELFASAASVVAADRETEAPVLSRGQQAIAKVYYDQAVSKDIDPASITLKFVGVPEFEREYDTEWGSDSNFEVGKVNFTPDCTVSGDVTKASGEGDSAALYVNGVKQDAAALVDMAAEIAAARN